MRLDFILIIRLIFFSCLFAIIFYNKNIVAYLPRNYVGNKQYTFPRWTLGSIRVAMGIKEFTLAEATFVFEP